MNEWTGGKIVALLESTTCISQCIVNNIYFKVAMSSASLTAKYRPQTFSDVAGQETVKSILSRAAKEEKVAAAYLFSGTRGVGKTTIARIFAKALNCVNAPTTEPCNVCEHCRRITAGNHVDVVEIDGASNRGIEDARRLRESIGYAAMEGRYKVFIIDEAHMLTREAFNALLKTLEEPPPRVTFFMATTEPHKFPVTIISRCQHYIFKRLSEQELEAHLGNILDRESVDYDSAAVKLIARRAAGSVRDSMSLLGQVLALGHESLQVEAVRSVLGLAGQELFFEVMDAVKAQDVVAVSSVIRNILDRGVDIGFFLRELATTWRNLFMLRQAGENALSLIDLPEDEAKQWLAFAPEFELSHIHASWQLTLEGQRRVLTSLEPAMALELLLLNLAFLPRLIPVANMGKGGAAPATPQGGTSNSRSGAPNAGAGSAGTVPPHRQAATRGPNVGANQTGQMNHTGQTDQSANPSSGMRSFAAGASAGPPAGHPAGHPAAENGPPPNQAPPPEDTDPNSEPSGPRDWDGFLHYCKEQNGEGGASVSILRSVPDKRIESDRLVITPPSQVVYDKLAGPDMLGIVKQRAGEYFGHGTDVIIHKPATRVRSFSEVRSEIEKHPTVRLLMDELGASILDYGHSDDPTRKKTSGGTTD